MIPYSKIPSIIQDRYPSNKTPSRGKNGRHNNVSSSPNIVGVSNIGLRVYENAFGSHFREILHEQARAVKCFFRISCKLLLAKCTGYYSQWGLEFRRKIYRSTPNFRERQPCCRSERIHKEIAQHWCCLGGWVKYCKIAVLKHVTAYFDTGVLIERGNMAIQICLKTHL